MIIDKQSPHINYLRHIHSSPNILRRDVEEYDKYVCAELCDDSTPRKKRLQELQLRYMIHTCNDGCFDDGGDRLDECKKGYPKEFQSETLEGEDTFPKYRRRSPADGGVSVETRNGGVIDNRRVVPHNLFILDK